MTALKDPQKEAWQAAERIKAEWRTGRRVDAAAALEAEPGLAGFRSVVIDLAYEEYLLRERQGEAPDAAEFARGFPDFQSSVQNLIEAHRLLLDQPGLVPAPEAEWPEVGGTVEGLELRRELGRGSFGRSYLAFDPGIGRLRVLKVTPGGATEARVIGGLNHENVVDVAWTRGVGSRTAVCMPFAGSATMASILEGLKGRTPDASAILEAATPTLEEPPDSRAQPVVRRKDRELVAAVAVAAKLARAVAYLHERPLVHGDIKPSNVVIQPGGAPLLIDFNLAAGDEPIHAIRGTPGYMAPEILDSTLAGNRVSFDGVSADRFALGVTVLEWLGGKHPYQKPAERGLAAYALALRTCRPLVPGLPASLLESLTACLSFEPAARPSADRLAEELEHFVLRSRTRRARTAFVGLGALAAVIIVGLTFGFIQRAERAAVERPPETAAEFHDRGIAALRSGKTAAARADFISAHELSSDPRELALAAYCYSRTGEHKTAITWNRQAIKDGVDTAEIRSNLGESLLKHGSIPEALKELDLAIEKSGELRAARYNRALAGYMLALNPKTRERLPQAVADMDEVLKVGPFDSELHLEAANLFALAQHHDRAFDQIQHSIRLGLPPAKLQRASILKRELGKDPRFAKLLKADAQPATPLNQHGLIEPFAN